MSEPSAKKPTKIRGGTAAAGARTRRALTELLGIAVPSAKWKVESALYTESGVKIGLRIGKRKPILFSIEPRTEESRGVVMTDRLVVSYVGKDLPASLTRLIAERGAKSLEGHDLSTLEEIFLSDPELGKGDLPVPDTGAMSNRPDSLLDSWGDSNAWADFFAVDELARGNLDSLDNLFVFVQHGDVECEHLFPHGPAPVLSLVSYPWDHRVRDCREPRPKEEGGMMLTSELDEDDVIRGNPEKLSNLLRRGVEEAERRGRTLFVSNTCVPVVTGEDVESEFRRCTASCSKTALYLTIGPESMVNVFHDLLVERRLRREKEVETEAENIVNLLGFPETRDLEELRSLLHDAGARVGAVIVPGVSEALVDALPKAALNVIRPASSWEHLYGHITSGSRLPSIRPGAPFGMEATRSWLEEICRVIGISGSEEVFTRRFELLRDRWEALREEASGLRIGLIVRAREIHNVLEPATTWGVPIIDMLEEMGFGLDVLLMFEQPEQVRVAKRVHEAFSEPDRHSIKGFDSLDRMIAQLDSMPAQAVFSHHTFDWRVTQSGKGIISLQQFEAGPEGALRTGERLVNICRTPFYRRLAPYLRRTREGERLSAGEEQ